METVLFFKFPAAPAQEYTDLEKYFSQSGNNRELNETYRRCLAKGELLVCKINHDQVSAEQKLGWTKVRRYLFLMLINCTHTHGVDVSDDATTTIAIRHVNDNTF